MLLLLPLRPRVLLVPPLKQPARKLIMLVPLLVLLIVILLLARRWPVRAVLLVQPVQPVQLLMLIQLPLLMTAVPGPQTI